MDEKYYLFFFLAFISEVIGTVSGFGSSILFVPMASLFFDFKSVLAITAAFHVFSNLSKIVLFKKGVNKEITLKLGIPAVIFVTIGAYATTFFNTASIEMVMNVILVFLSFYLILHFNKTLKQTDANLYIGGMASGFLAGFTGTGGAIRGVVLTAFHLSKDVFIATSALIDLGVDISRSAVYIFNGYFKIEHLYLMPFLLIISIVGSYVGKQILKKIPDTIFRYAVLIVIICASLFQVYKYFNS